MFKEEDEDDDEDSDNEIEGITYSNYSSTLRECGSSGEDVLVNTVIIPRN